MFTGIVQTKVPIREVKPIPGKLRLVIDNSWPDLKHGESVAINGVCLTVADLMEKQVGFDAIPETLARTNLGKLQAGDLVNLERSLRIGDRLDGHFVQGHVDGTGRFLKIGRANEEWRITIDVEAALAKYLAYKGSISIDGVSLTIARLDGTQLDVALIPTTLQITTLGDRTEGYMCNIECDMIAKQIVAFMEQRHATTK